MKILVLGAGWVGEPLALHLDKSYDVSALSRSPSIALSETLGSAFIESTWQAFAESPADEKWDVIVCLLPPSAFDLENEPALAKLVQKINSAADHLILSSSTSVYPQDSGVYGEEDAVRIVSKHSGKAMLDLEVILTQDLSIPFTILRLGGLVGLERKPWLRWEHTTWEDGGGMVNFVHLIDVVGAISLFIEKRKAGIFNVVAPFHPTRKALRDRYFNPSKIEQFPPIPKEGRIVSSAKLCDVLGFSFKEPDPLNFPELK